MRYCAPRDCYTSRPYQTGATRVAASPRWLVGFFFPLWTPCTLARRLSHARISICSVCILARITRQDAVALLRLDDLYVDSFQVQDVKTLTGDHLRYASTWFHAFLLVSCLGYLTTVRLALLFCRVRAGFVGTLNIYEASLAFALVT